MRVDDYLKRIRQPAPRAASVDAVHALHRAHREAFLFENLSIQTGGGISLALCDLERKFLDEGRGGYCFEHNTLFAGRPVGARRLHLPPAPRSRAVGAVGARRRGGNGPL